MSGIPFSPSAPDLETVRRIIFERLRREPNWNYIDRAGQVTAIYDFVRGQRNDLGHPRERPPAVTQEDAFVNLQIFPRYYQTAEEVRAFLSKNRV